MQLDERSIDLGHERARAQREVYEESSRLMQREREKGTARAHSHCRRVVGGKKKTRGTHSERKTKKKLKSFK